MGLRTALIGGVIGLVVGILLMLYIMSNIGSNFNQMERDILTYSIPVLFCLICAYIGYEYN